MIAEVLRVERVLKVEKITAKATNRWLLLLRWGGNWLQKKALNVVLTALVESLFQEPSLGNLSFIIANEYVQTCWQSRNIDIDTN